MARHTNLMRRGAVYYALVHVPTDLQATMGGKKQIWRSLETKDYGEAKRRLTAHVDQWSSTFDDMRRRRDLTDADMRFGTTTRRSWRKATRSERADRRPLKLMPPWTRHSPTLADPVRLTPVPLP